jgi:hypothetical protein
LVTSEEIRHTSGAGKEQSANVDSAAPGEKMDVDS